MIPSTFIDKCNDVSYRRSDLHCSRFVYVPFERYTLVAVIFFSVHNSSGAGRTTKETQCCCVGLHDVHLLLIVHTTRKIQRTQSALFTADECSSRGRHHPPLPSDISWLPLYAKRYGRSCASRLTPLAGGERVQDRRYVPDQEVYGCVTSVQFRSNASIHV